MSRRYDLAIVGASFAGLAAAERAAQRGLRTVVLERRSESGRPLHTTGIFVREAADLMPLPPELVRAVSGVRLYAPSLKYIDLESAGYAFYATDTPGVLRWMAENAARAGAEIRYGVPFETARMTDSGVHIESAGIEAAWLIGADGAKSTVAGQFGLGRNRRFLVGIEAEYRGVAGLDEKFLHTFIDRRLAPGYIGWVVPSRGVVQVGIAAKRLERPEFQAFLARIAPLFDFSGADAVERRSGVIPVGGVVAPVARERVILVGDAAGMVSPLTAGGIYTALKFGRRAAEAIAEHAAGAAPHPARVLPGEYPRFRIKSLLRRGLDFGPPNWLFNLAIGTRPMRSLAKLVYFHTKGLGSKAAWQEIAGPRGPGAKRSG